MNTLIKKFGTQKRWVNWHAEVRDGKTTKVPIGKSNDPKTWSKYEDLPSKENIGLMFGLKKMLLGIDIDKCLNPIDGTIDSGDTEKDAMIATLLSTADTYAEISPSGTGLHLFLNLTEPLTLKANRKNSFECYTSERYFTVTQQPFGEEKDVRTCTAAEAEAMLAIVGYPWKEERTAAPYVAPAQNGLSMSDDEVLRKAFGAKNGEKLKALYNGDLTQNNGDNSIADLNLCGQLAFWCQGDKSQIERLWLASPLGAREKTQERIDYRNRTLNEAVAGCKEFYKPSTNPGKVLAQKLDLELLFTLVGKDKVKVYTLNTENMCRVLRKHPDFAGRFRFDNFRNVMEISVNGKWRELEDNDAVDIQTKISIIFDFFGKVGKMMIYDAIIKVAKENEIDSATDYIKSLAWDGENRIESWLQKAYGCSDSEYHRKVGSNWIKGLVKRIVQPGCKFDYVLVLEGPQGSKKSTSLATLGGDWHIETTMSTDTKDFFMQFLGNVIVEFSEGETLSRTEVKRMKAIITTQFDKYRLPYERMTKSFPRRCVFAMTTNQEEYLKDETGNRRWLPVKVEFDEADVEWIAAFRDQLFAEAYHRVVILNETIYEFPKEETMDAQNARRITDPNADLIEDWFHNKLTMQERGDGITADDVFRNVLHGQFGANKPMSKYEEMSITSVFRTTLQLEKKRVMIGGARATRWFMKDSEILNSENIAQFAAPLKLSDF